MGPPERLESWKEIAAYLNRGTRTVQRWEKLEGLPVHRHVHEKQGTVYAFKEDIDAWWASRRTRLSAEDEPPPAAHTPSHRTPRWRVAATAALILLAMTGGAISSRSSTWGSPPLYTGRSVPITSAPGFEYSPSFSPDGRYIAYTAQPEQKNGSDIFIQAIDRAESRKLTDRPGFHTAPVWSPDGQSIAYIRVADEHSDPEIIVRPAVGGVERRIATWTGERMPIPVMAWSRDPRWIIVAVAPKPRVPTSIFRMNVQSGDLHPITEPCTDCAGDSSIALSNDGRTLAFLRYRRAGVRDIYLLPLTAGLDAASPPRRLTHHDALVSAPVWMPGDDELAYSLIVDFTFNWRRVSRRSGVSRPIESFANFRPSLVFSPDGRHVAYSHSLTDLDIRRVDLATGEESPAIVSTRIDANPHISPDGTQVVFASDRRGNIDIWKSAPDGSNAVMLASFPGKSSGTPRWSPDGTQIAFDVTENTNADLYVMAADGARIRRLTTEPSRDFVPSWSRDGLFLYFGSDRSGDHQIWRIPAAGGPAVQITRNGGYGSLESVDGKSLFLTKFAGKNDGLAGLFRLDLTTGAEERIIPNYVDWSRTAVTAGAVYFIAWKLPEGEHWLKRFDLATGRTDLIRKLNGAPSVGFSLSPDATWLLYAAAERRGADLMLAEVRR